MSLPLPNDKIGNYRVVASCHYREFSKEESENKEPTDDWPDTVYLVLLLADRSPYFMVAHVAESTEHVVGWRVLNSEIRRNIVEAVYVYKEWGGDI